MEKFYAAFCLLLLNLGFVVSSDVYGQDVLFISTYASKGDMNDSDEDMYDRLVNMGLTVHLKGSSGNMPVASDADGKDMVLISATMYSGNVNSIFRDVTVPVMVTEGYIFDDMMMTGNTSSDYGEKEKKHLHILDDTHYITATSSLTGKIKVFDEDEDMFWGKPSSDADLIAKIRDNKYGIFVYETGDQMVGMTAPGLRIGFFIGASSADELTDKGWDLFDNAVNYCLNDAANQTPTCDDVIDAGTIAGNETECGSFDADKILSISEATSSVEYDYLWVKSTLGSRHLSAADSIPGAHSATFTPGNITETTWYSRLAKGTGCADYTLQSNIIAKAVTNCDINEPQVVAPSIPYSQCDLTEYTTGDHAITFTMAGESLQDYIFDENGGSIKYYSNGTAHITGLIKNILDNNKQWYVDVWFKNRRNWNTWSDLGRSYKSGGDGSKHEDWDYYELDDTRSMFIGLGDYDDEFLYLSHNPSNFNYGLQIGEGANDKNSEYGLSAWYTFTSASGNYSGHGDFNTLNSCENICTPDIVSTVEDVEKYGPSNHALWLVESNSAWNTDFYFDADGGTLKTENDGTGSVTGIIYNKNNSNNKWRIDIKLINKKDWETWESLGRSYKSGGGGDHESWDYYEIDNNNSFMYGLASNAGKTLTIRHDPASYLYGVQVGYGANDKNSNYGLSGWIAFSGDHSGYGDLNLNITNTETTYGHTATFVCTGTSYDEATGYAFDFGSYKIGGVDFNEFVFDDPGASITTYFGNNAHISGTIYHPSNTNLKWQVSLWFKNKKDWSEWKSDGGTYNYTLANELTADDHHAFWDFYELDGDRSVMIGQGTHIGDTLFVTQSLGSADGFQIGIGANGKNSSFGFSGVFNYTSHSGNYNGTANMNLSLDCEEYCSARPRISSRFLLEGNYNISSSSMDTKLNSADVIPLKNPYTESPWNYTGHDSVSEIPGNNLVDWVLVEARKKDDSTQLVNSKVGFLTKDGDLVGLDGKSYLEVELGDNTDDYYFIIRHRNHLAIMTKSPKAREGRVYFEDFSDNLDKAFNNPSVTNTAMNPTSNGEWVMIAGDANGNGGINSVDLGLQVSQYFLAGYLMVDVTLNSVSNSVDLFRSVTNYFNLTHVPSEAK